MVSRSHVGSHELLARLTSQVGSEGMARAILIKRKQMTSGGKLTAAGKRRDAMTAEERAVDRATKASKHPTKDFKYSPSTNRATLRKK